MTPRPLAFVCLPILASLGCAASAPQPAASPEVAVVDLTPKQEEAPKEKAPEKAPAKYSVSAPPDEPQPSEAARQEAIETAKRAGILGLLQQGDQAATPFGHAPRFGEDPLDSSGSLMGAESGEAFGAGGLGLVGTGRGGGGTGEGTIGIGRIGSIGHGSGTGQGYGRGAGQLGGSGSSALPQVKPGGATVTGKLDAEIIRRVVRRHLNQVRYCYQKELVKDPALAGKITVQFTIARDGSVPVAATKDSTMNSKAVEACVLSRVRTWMFPAPEGGIVVVNYPFAFAAAPGAAPAPAPASAPGAAPAPAPAAAPAPAPAPKPAPAPPLSPPSRK